MKLKYFINKPEYYFNFKWIFSNRSKRNARANDYLVLPWNLKIAVFNDQIGNWQQNRSDKIPTRHSQYTSKIA